LSKGDSQESGAVSLEEEILKRYTQQSEEPSSEAEPSSSAGGEGKETGSLEDEILRRYSASDDPDEKIAPDEEAETGSSSLEEDILEKYTSGASESEDDPKPTEEPSSGVDEEVASSDYAKTVAQVIDDRPAPAMKPMRTPPAMPVSPEEVVETLRRLREDVGQISELSSEEENIVAAFALAFLKLMEPLTKALPVDTSILPRELGSVEKANVVPRGDLVILHSDGRMESLDLTDKDNRDLLIATVSDVMPRFNSLISQRRSKIEKRITFLSSVTKELQTIADSFETVV
jgi:hypothetical protein